MTPRPIDSSTLCARADTPSPQILEQPEPLFLFLGFGSSSLDLQFSAWTPRESHFRIKADFLMLVKRELERNGVEIPFPQVAVSASRGTGPLPVAVVEGRQGDDPRTAADGGSPEKGGTESG